MGIHLSLVGDQQELQVTFELLHAAGYNVPLLIPETQGNRKDSV
jgi:hypothetical protein